MSAGCQLSAAAVATAVAVGVPTASVATWLDVLDLVGAVAGMTTCAVVAVAFGSVIFASG